MVPRLIERWTAGVPWFEVVDAASGTTARERVRTCAAAAGLGAVATEGLATAASELATNLLRHARGGRMSVHQVQRLQAGGPVAGVEVVAADRGPGISDPAGALAGVRRGAGPGLGSGLAGARRLSQELDLDTRQGEGTCLRVRTFAAPVARSEVGVLGRPLQGERVNGDDCLVVRGEGSLLVAVADGLGHGPEARAASTKALAAVHAEPAAPLDQLLARAAAAVEGTRGVVLALARLDLATREVEHVGVGDVRVAVQGPSGTTLLPGSPGSLSGRPHARLRARAVRATLSPHGALLLCTDGLRSGAAPRPGPIPEVVRLASELAADFARGTDDLLVVAVRSG